MKTTHTPGPWSPHSYVGNWAAVHSENGLLKNIALVTGGEPDACLIAAAPDLLEALNQAVTSMQDSGYPNSHVAVRAARAAIAKATAVTPNTGIKPRREAAAG